MSKEIKIAGSISFGGKRLNVYGDLDAPLFKAKDISNAIGYSSGNEWRMLEMCEEDEKLKLPLVVAGQRRSVNFVTENGLYNILAQSRTNDAINKAMILLLTLPLEVLMDHYWTKTYAKRIPEFTEHVLKYYEKWQNDELDMDKLKEDLWIYGGVRLEEVEGK